MLWGDTLRGSMLHNATSCCDMQRLVTLRDTTQFYWDGVVEIQQSAEPYGVTNIMLWRAVGCYAMLCRPKRYA
eukprot:4291665-Pyramimonas_sp.AAC.1